MNVNKRDFGLLGIIGYPLTHTMSPYLHNYLFEKKNLNLRYFPFEVKPEHLERAIDGIRALGIKGLNVTVPYKQKVIPYLDRVSKEAKQIGAVNTIENKSGVLKGYNTDVLGFSRTLKEEKVEIEDTKAIVLGAGGAARAVLYSLIENDIHQIAIYNRTLANARVLARELSEKLEFAKFKCHQLNENHKLRKDLEDTKLLVNTTPVGMYPATNKSPLESDVQLNENLVVFDLIYNPPKTKLLKRAEKLCAKTINGLDMLIYQGIEALNIWLAEEIVSGHLPGLRSYLRRRLKDVPA